MSGNDNDDDKKPTAEILAWPKNPMTRPPAPRPEANEGPKDEAEALVIKALASITGREPADIIRDIRAREEAAQAEGNDEPSNVVDLNAVREARQKAHTDSGIDLGEVFRTGFRAVMDQLAQQRPAGGEIVIDADFMRQNGTRILGNVFQSLSRAFLDKPADSPPPGDAQPSVDSGHAANEPAAAASEPHDTRPEPQRPVEVRLDLGSIAMSLLDRFGLFRGAQNTAPSAEDKPTEPAAERPEKGERPEDTPPD